MERNNRYHPESIYDNYLSAEGPRHSQMSGASERVSLAPPMPRGVAGRSLAMSMADTSSVYSTNGGARDERWSLEQGLAGMESGSSADVYARSSTRPSVTSMHGTEVYNGNNIPRIGINEPLRADVPTTTSTSPAPIQYNRRHFSRPLRQDSTLRAESEIPAITTPKITVGHHRFSASTPDAYGGANISSPAMDADSPRSSTYSSDIAAFPDPTHLRRRSLPVNGMDEAGDRTSFGEPSTGSLRGPAARHGQKESLSNLSIIESEDEVVAPSRKSPDPRPFSLSNTYPFSTSANGYGNQATTRTLNHKPSSRFSEDEKRENIKSMSSNNDLQASTWNLFGRSPTASPMWGQNEKFVSHGVASQQQKANASRRKKRRLLIIVAGVLTVAMLAGAGVGIGIWQSHRSNDTAGSGAAKDRTGSRTAAEPPTSGEATPTTSGESADVQMPARDANASPGSGGPGGYNQIVAFGGSYGDDGHTRLAQYASTLHNESGYDHGRSTDGPIYQEYLSELIGPREGESSTMFNYAYNGASLNNTLNTAQTPDLPQQVSSYLSDLDGGNATVTASGNSKTLITVWAGLEELVAVWEAAVAANPTDPGAMAIAGVQAMLATLATTLSWLIAADSTDQNRPDFVLFTVPSASVLPETARIDKSNTVFFETFENMTTTFNNGLAGVAERLNTTTVFALDAQKLFDDLYEEPSLYNLTTVQTSCRSDSCTNPKEYMWYDDFNPTTTMHRLVARRLAAVILTH